MVTTVRQLFVSSTTSTDNAANLQFVKRGHITAVHLAVQTDNNTDGDQWVAEVSFFPTFQGQTNDPNGPIITLHGLFNVLTSGATSGSHNASISGIAIPVEPGMKAYINTLITSTDICRVIAQIYVTN